MEAYNTLLRQREMTWGDADSKDGHTVSPSWSLCFLLFELGLAPWLLWPIECGKIVFEVFQDQMLNKPGWLLFCILGNTSHHLRRTHHAVRKSKLWGPPGKREMTDWPLVVQPVSAEVPRLQEWNRLGRSKASTYHGNKDEPSSLSPPKTVESWANKWWLF